MVKMDLRKQIKLFYFIVAFDLMLLAAIAAAVGRSSVREKDYLKTSLDKDPHGFSKTVALTFDDDVIIGLSQEISYKEAVSMI